MRYSLATHILSITSKSTIFNTLFENVKIGGEGDALSSITINKSTNTWETKGYATGGYVHNKNLSKIGTVEVAVSQLSDIVAKFKTCCSYYYSANSDTDDIGLTLTLTEAGTEKVIAICEDCLITNIPSQEFGESAGDQRWTFTCGEVDIK